MIALSRLQEHTGGLVDRTMESLFLKLCSVVNEGSLEVTLPGGGKLGVYQPRHARPEPISGPAPQ